MFLILLLFINVLFIVVTFLLPLPHPEVLETRAYMKANKAKALGIILILNVQFVLVWFVVPTWSLPILVIGGVYCLYLINPRRNEIDDRTRQAREQMINDISLEKRREIGDD